MLATVWLCLVTTPSISADFSPDVVRQARNATALVVVPGRGFGTAFCIDRSGYFITNEHVVRSIMADKKLVLVMKSGDEQQRVIPATVVRSDKQSDLALLHVEVEEDLPSLQLGTVDDLFETQQLAVFGFPYGTALAVKEKKYPSISVNLSRVSSLRRNKGELERIQLDA